MSVWRLSWQYLWARPGRAWANLFALTLALTAMLVVLSMHDQIRHNFERQLKGIDAVVGAKGSPISSCYRAFITSMCRRATSP